MSIADKISRLQTAKSNIASAITDKGGTVSSGDGFEDFASAIAGIPIGKSGHRVTITCERHPEQPSDYQNHEAIIQVIYGDYSHEQIAIAPGESITRDNAIAIINWWWTCDTPLFDESVGNAEFVQGAIHEFGMANPLGDTTIVKYQNYCLTGDTLILMADGSSRRIDSLKAGDKVLSYNPKTMRLEKDSITFSDAAEHKSFSEWDKWLFEDGFEVHTVHPHRFFNVEHQEMVYMDQWKLGEHALTREGKTVALLSHETVKEEVRHYTIFTKNQNYFANGLLSGNRHTQKLSFK